MYLDIHKLIFSSDSISRFIFTFFRTVTPVAGLIFEAKIERYFLESFFRERNFCPEQLFRAKNVARF